MNRKFNIEDVFNDPEFNSIEYEKKASLVKTDEERLVDSFEEINAFFDKNNRAPNSSSMSEYGLLAKLKNFRQSEAQKKTLKPFDRHNLLGYVEIDKPSIIDIFDDEDFKVLNESKDLDIFKFKHTPKLEDRAEADFIARRKPIKEKNFEKYEQMFLQVHKEIKEGKRKIVSFSESSFKENNYYILDGIVYFLEKINHTTLTQTFPSGERNQTNGRTRIIFENGTLSNMFYRSLIRAMYESGKMITKHSDSYNQDLFVNTGLVKEEDLQTGWIYILKSQSTNKEIAGIKDLYKIGFASSSVDDRTKNAKNEATYLFADVKKIATYKVYNRNADKLESLLHRFFASACLDIDLFNEKGQRLNPREWFVVPFEVIEESIELILNENIVNYEYDTELKRIKLKE